MASLFLIALLGVVISMVIGTLWHMPNVPTGKLHMDYIGFTKLSASEQERQMKASQPHMWKSFLGQAILSYMSSLFIVFVMYYTTQGGVASSMVYGYVCMIWLGFVIPTFGWNLIWWGHDHPARFLWIYFISQAIYYLISYLVIAYVFHFFF